MYANISKIRQPRRFAVKKFYRLNHQIQAQQLRVLGDDGQIGVLTKEEALKKAHEQGVDLVEIAPDAKPPVARLIDYKKFKYLEDKKEKEARKKTKQTELKEVRFTPFIGEHDFQTGMRKVREFLGEGDIVKISVVFKGRQMTHQEFGPKLLLKIMTELGPGAQQERQARMEGRRYVTVIRAAKGTFKKAETTVSGNSSGRAPDDAQLTDTKSAQDTRPVSASTSGSSTLRGKPSGSDSNEKETDDRTNDKHEQTKN